MTTQQDCRWPDDSFSWEEYNALPTVEDADEARRAHPRFPDLLSNAAPLIVDSGYELQLGFFLLHKHFRIQSDERMVEALDASDEALVTTPRMNSASVAASRWRTSPHGLTPLEFSTDAAVTRVGSRLGAEKGLVGELTNLIEQFGLAEVIGIAVTERDSLPLSPGLAYVEENFGENRRSVITRSRPENADQLIETVWSFRRVDPIVLCNPQYMCTSTIRCNRTGYCRSTGTGHEKEHEPRSEHDQRQMGHEVPSSE